MQTFLIKKRVTTFHENQRRRTSFTISNKYLQLSYLCSYSCPISCYLSALHMTGCLDCWRLSAPPQQNRFAQASPEQSAPRTFPQSWGTSDKRSSILTQTTPHHPTPGLHCASWPLKQENHSNKNKLTLLWCPAHQSTVLTGVFQTLDQSVGWLRTFPGHPGNRTNVSGYPRSKF